MQFLELDDGQELYTFFFHTLILMMNGDIGRDDAERHAWNHVREEGYTQIEIKIGRRTGLIGLEVRL